MTNTSTTLPHRSELSGFERACLVAILVVVLLLSCATGILTSYMLGVVSLAIVVYGALQQRYDWQWDLMAKVFALVFAGIALTYTMTARQPSDLGLILNFIMFLAYIPVATLLARFAGPSSGAVVAWLALGGSGIGAAYAVIDVLITGTTRAGSFQTDPIRLANTALLLGFIALIGLRSITGWLRYLTLLGPIFALVTILETGSRNAMVSFAALVVVAVVMLSPRWYLGAIFTALAIAIAATTVTLIDSDRVISLVVTVQEMLSGAPVSDTSMAARLELYRAALPAFLQSPWFGHGWAGMMPSILPYLPPDQQIHAALPHLHNEAINFAVSSGLVGILIYVTLLTAPIVAVLRSPRDRQRQIRIVATAFLVVGYFTMGLADTMLSYEIHTALYVGFCAILIAYCRDTPINTTPTPPRPSHRNAG